MIVRNAKSSGLSEVAALRGRRGGGRKKRKKKTPPALQTFGKIKQFTERNYYNIWCQFSSKPYRKVKNSSNFRQVEQERRLDIRTKYNKVINVFIYI